MFRSKRVYVAILVGAAVATFSSGLFAHASTNNRSHISSGLTDRKGNMLYVESGRTPDVSRLAPTISFGGTKTTNKTNTQGTMSASPQTNATVQQSGTTLGPNLIPNPSFETSGSNGLPTGWLKGGYGTNSHTLTYPATPAEDGSRAASVSISSYSSGDAKWYFNYVPVTAGETYQFSDWSFSNVSSEVDVQFKMSDGTFKYLVIAEPGPSKSYENTVAEFTAPAGAVSLTVFHLIDRVGNITVDNYSLNQVNASSANPNLIQNGDFETAGSSGVPEDWNEGGWGSNTHSFSYPVNGVNGSKAVQVSISSYSSGDAKWYFNPIVLHNGIYTYSDTYKSNVPSVVE